MEYVLIDLISKMGRFFERYPECGLLWSKIPLKCDTDMGQDTSLYQQNHVGLLQIKWGMFE